MLKNIDDLAKKMKELDNTTKIKDNVKVIKLLTDVIYQTLLVDGDDIKLGKLLKIELVDIDNRQFFNAVAGRVEHLPKHTVVKLKKLSLLKNIDGYLREENSEIARN